MTLLTIIGGLALARLVYWFFYIRGTSLLDRTVRRETQFMDEELEDLLYYKGK